MTSPPDPSPGVPDEEFDPEAALKRAVEFVDSPEERERQDLIQARQARVREEAGRRWRVLLDLAGALHRVGRVEDLFEKILVSALEITNADRAYLLRKNQDGTLDILASRTGDGGPGDPDELAEVSHTILERVLEQGKTLYVSDALNNPDFMSQRSVRELSLRTVVAVPLPGVNGTGGALYVSSGSVAGLVEEEGVGILEAFAAQAALALEAAAHREELEEAAQSLETANRSLKHALGDHSRFDKILGRSPAMQRVFQVLERVISTEVSVLVQGETGTGKELVARALHFNGPRREANFIAINCGAIPESLLESELFGYRKGAFTGADADHVGLVETADGGTLFLDEIGELSSTLQVRLLRVLQEGEVRRIGESTPRMVNVRFVSATNRDLAEEVRADRFREDLFYRINVVTVNLPPLRERGEDILLLAQEFLVRTRQELNRPDLRLGAEARRFLMSHNWPGNIRELQNAVSRAGALAQTDRIEPQDLLPGIRSRPAVSLAPGGGRTLKEILDQTAEATIRGALKEADGNISQAARLLGISRQHLHTKLRALNIPGRG